MAHQYVAVRSLNRSAEVRVVDKDGNKVKLTPTVDTIVDLDLGTNRRALNNHATIGQWVVSAANAFDGGVGLPSNS